nr:AHH domain-containing protein [Thermoactinomyces sp. DSM 45891]
MQLAGKIDCPSISSDRLIPGTPGRVTGGNSTKLGKNLLEDMDLPRSSSRKGYQAQHIIPSEMRNHPVIQKVGMDFDDASNGIFLPVPNDKVHSLATHRGYHSSYNQAVENELNKLDVNQSTRDLEKQVHDLQQRLKYLQKNGLPLYPSKGGSLDLWDRWLNK